MNLVFLGAPGAGKGTQATKVCEALQLKHLSSGDLLREQLSQQTPLGLKAKAFMDQGLLVPDQLVLNIIEVNLPKTTGFLMDGFPRNIEQAKTLDGMLKTQSKEIDWVVRIDVEQDQLVERMMGRGRKDDNMETIRNRLIVYEKQTEPLSQYYEKKLKVVDGLGTQDEVFGRIIAAIKKPLA